MNLEAQLATVSVAGLAGGLLGWSVVVITSRIEHARRERHPDCSAPTNCQKAFLLLSGGRGFVFCVSGPAALMLPTVVLPDSTKNPLELSSRRNRADHNVRLWGTTSQHLISHRALEGLR